MSLSAVGNPAWETIRGVRFSMLDGPTLVTVLVTHATLSELEHVRSGEGGHLACFEKHRDALEHVADVKYQRGVVEKTGAVIIQSGDLKTFT